MGYDEWDRIYRLTVDAGAATLPGMIDARRRGEMLVIRRSVG